MISLFSWKRASHNSDTLGSQQVPDKLGVFRGHPGLSTVMGREDGMLFGN